MTAERIYDIFHYTIPLPTMGGPLHLTVLLITIAGSLCVLRWGQNMTRKRLNLLLTISAVIFILLELYKQIILQFILVDGRLVHVLNWRALPVFLCSMPIYFLPLAVVVRKGKVHNAILAFLCTYSFLAAVAVLIFPAPVFYEMVGLTLQSLTVHVIMVLNGLMILMYKRKELTRQFFTGGVVVFLVLVAVALALSMVVHASGAVPAGDVFFPLQINPYYVTPLPVYSTIQQSTPYPVFLAFYVLSFTAGSFLVYCGQVFLTRRLYRTI